MLLAEGAVPPWPAVIVSLARGFGRACGALAAPLVPRGRFAVGASVHAFDAKYNGWKPGRVVREREDGGDVWLNAQALRFGAAYQLRAVAHNGLGASEAGPPSQWWTALCVER